MGVEYTCSYMTDRTKTILIIGGLAVVVALGVVWYLATHRAPNGSLIQIATSTPATSTPIVTAATPLHITENAAYYDIDAQYPSSTVLKQSANVSADAAAVATMKTFEQDTIAQFKKDGNFANLTHDDIQMIGLDQRKYALDIEYKTYQSPRTVSYVYTIYADTLGAHPNAYYRTFTFDTKTGANLSLGDVFASNSSYIQKLSDIAHAKLPAILAKIEGVSVSEVDTEQLNPGITATADNFQNFYLDGNNLVIVFPPYQVGPYALGTILLPIARADLGAMLKSEYR